MPVKDVRPSLWANKTKSGKTSPSISFVLCSTKVKNCAAIFSVLRTNKQNISTLRLKIAPYPLSTDVSPRPYLMKWVVGLAHQYDLFSSLRKV